MYLEKLKALMKVPKQIYNAGNSQAWEEYQAKYHCEFPFDYKEFINTYGTGGINNFMWILTPYESNEEINLWQRAEIMSESYSYMKDLSPQKHHYSIYPDEGGLLPWGYTDNGDELYFNNGSVVVFEARYADYYEYNMGMIEFLYKLFTKGLTCNAFPDDFIRSPMEYSSVKF